MSRQEPLPRSMLRPAGAVERLVAWVPLVGWVAGAVLARVRALPIRREILARLQARGPLPADVWQHEPLVGPLVCRALGDALELPGDRLLPDDPLEVLFYAGMDVLDQDDAVRDACTAAGLTPPHDEEWLLVPTMTVGQLVAKLAHSHQARTG